MTANKELSTQEFNQLLEYYKKDPKGFLNWVRSNYPHLAKIAESEEETYKYLRKLEEESRKDRSFLQKVGQMATGIFIPNSKSFYGDNPVSQAAKENAEATAFSSGIANFINIITSAPLLWYALGNLPLFIAVLTCVLGFSNTLSSAVASKRPENKKWSKSSAVGLVAINLLFSLLAIPGTFLLLGQEDLAQSKARNLFHEELELRKNDSVNAQKEKEEKLDIFSSSIQANINSLQSQIDTKNNSIKKLEIDRQTYIEDLNNNPDARKLYMGLINKVEGDISRIQNDILALENNKQNEQNLLAKIKTGNIPSTPEYDQLKQDITKLNDQIDFATKLEKYESQPVSYLYHCKPDIFDREFKLADTTTKLPRECSLKLSTVNTNDVTMLPPQDFRIKSGLTATEQAFTQFFNTLGQGEYAKLSFPLFFFLLSSVTSIVALSMAFNLSENDDIKDSRDRSYQNEKSAIISIVRESLDRQPNLN